MQAFYLCRLLLKCLQNLMFSVFKSCCCGPFRDDPLERYDAGVCISIKVHRKLLVYGIGPNHRCNEKPFGRCKDHHTVGKVYVIAKMLETSVVGNLKRRCRNTVVKNADGMWKIVLIDCKSLIIDQVFIAFFSNKSSLV